MNTQRYVVCGVVSIALHSLALSAQQPVQHNVAVEDNHIGQRVAIQLVARASQPPSQPEPMIEKQTSPSTTPVADHTTVKQSDVVKQPDVKKTPVKKPPVKKPQVKAASVKKVPIKKTPVKQAAVTKVPEPNAPAKNPTPAPKPKTKPEQAAPKQEIAQPTANADMNQAKDSAPTLIDRPTFKVRPTQPAYPRIARRKGLEGNVLIEVWLDEKGLQTRLEIAQSSGHAVLDDAAMKAVKKWRFNGYQENGARLAHRVKIPVRFNLD